MPAYDDHELARALLEVLGTERWEAVALSRGFLALANGSDEESAARLIYDHSNLTLRRSREIAANMSAEGLRPFLAPRRRIGSAENPITKLLPATVTEARFAELLDALSESRSALEYVDDREARSLVDFSIRDVTSGAAIPINVKNAGTRFEQAKRLVGLEPEDCVPIPAYKAHGALESQPDLLYVVSVDYDLKTELDRFLPTILTPGQRLAWHALGQFTGSGVRNAEDLFIFRVVKEHWGAIRAKIRHPPFHVISARKAIRLLQTKPERTPGIGLRAWGTGASAEVNVHVSIDTEMTDWDTVADRIMANGVEDIVRAINRKILEEVYDPEI